MTLKHAKKKNKERKIMRKLFAWAVVLFIAAAVVIIAVALITQSQMNVENSMYPIKYDSYVKKASKEYNLDEALIYGVIKTESDFNPDAESRAGAKGIMQIMPETFEWLQVIRGASGDYTEDDLLEPKINIDYGCYLLRYFLDLYGTEQAAIAAYNAGFIVGDWLEDSTYSTDGVTLDYIPYPETSAYVEKVLAAKDKYKELYFSENKQ